MSDLNFFVIFNVNLILFIVFIYLISKKQIKKGWEIFLGTCIPNLITAITLAVTIGLSVSSEKTDILFIDIFASFGEAINMTIMATLIIHAFACSILLAVGFSNKKELQIKTNYKKFLLTLAINILIIAILFFGLK